MKMKAAESLEKTELIIAQPLLAPYRLPVFRKLAQAYKTKIICSPTNDKDGFGCAEANGLQVEYHPVLNLGPHLHYQKGLVSALLRYRPMHFLVAANPRNLAVWLSLVICRLLGVRSYAHGHGAYNKENPGIFTRLMYCAMARLATVYICYTHASRQSMLGMGCNPARIRVAENSVSNEFSMPFQDKDFSGDGLLFVGRLRRGCQLELLLQCMPHLTASHPGVVLHVVGDGELSGYYQKLAATLPNVVFHGRLYDDKSIANIAAQCVLGLYPGDAGLSVVHYMSLSLPPVVHNNLRAHGPEPSYIENGSNGFTFNHGDGEDLCRVLLHVLSDKETLKKAAQQAWLTYEALVDPDLADRLLAIMNEASLPC